MKLKSSLGRIASGVSLMMLLGSSSVALAQATIDGGATVTVPGSQSSPWDVGGNLTVGNLGNGTLNIAGGGFVSSAIGLIGNAAGSSGNVTVSGAGSQWTNTGPLYVAGSGNGTLTIAGGGIVTSTSGVIGHVPGGTGNATVSGAGSQWNNSSEFFVGDSGIGTLVIADGGNVSNTIGHIGNNPGSSGNAIVRGVGSQWSNSSLLEIGHDGNGTLEIADGGIVSSAIGFIGLTPSGVGKVTASGAGSQWNISADLVVGYSGNGTLEIADGGNVSNANGQIGLSSTGTGRIIVSGAGSRWSNIGNLYVGNSGNGTLAIADQGAVTASGVVLANSGTSSGILAIGAVSGAAPVAPGTITTTSITFGSGAGRIVFNHTSSNYVFDATLNGGANNAAGSGTGLVGSGLVEALSGRTIFDANHGSFIGILQAGGAGILQVNGSMAGASVNILAGGMLEGNGIVGNTVNAGTIAPGASIGTLTIAGNYVGNGGALHIEAVLGNDASPTDRLVISGTVSGTTTVTVTNLGGHGAMTENGIQIIQVGGVSPADAFVLNGDYITATGQPAEIGGAYAYILQHGGTTTPGNGNWYLTSEMVVMNPDTGLPEIDPETGLPEVGPRYQPGVPLYEQYGQVLALLNTVPTLQQRIGNRYWQQGDSSSGMPQTYGMWGRIEGSRTQSDPARSTAQAHRDTDLWKLQTGFDFVARQNADGMLVGGVNVSYGTASSEIGSPYGRGKVNATGTGIGATLTWYGANGFYVDTQAQAMFFDSDITSTTIGRKEVKGNGGHGLALSGETGWRYGLGNGFSLTPQVQLAWSRVDFDSFTDPFGARISLNDGDSLRGRFGVSLDHEAGWVASDGSRSRSHIYGIANLYNEFLDGTKVDVSSVRFSTRDERLWAGVGVGGTYEWSNGKYALYGNANIASSLKHAGDNYAFGGTLGFRARW